MKFLPAITAGFVAAFSGLLVPCAHAEISFEQVRKLEQESLEALRRRECTDVDETALRDSGVLAWFDSELFLSPGDEKSGVFVVAHGLNMKPEKMDFMIQALLSRGYDVGAVRFMGHRGERGGVPEDLGAVRRSIWLDELFSVYCVARARAHSFDGTHVPVNLLGYSLGGLMGEDLLNFEFDREEIRFDAALLFAPALAVHGSTELMRVFQKLGSIESAGEALLNLWIPSLSPIEYRANHSTRAAFYYSLFNSMDAVEKTGFRRSNIPTLVVVDENDEVVSEKGLREMIGQYRLDQWEMLSISREIPGDEIAKLRDYHHIVIDEKLGPELWAEVSAAMDETLGRSLGFSR